MRTIHLPSFNEFVPLILTAQGDIPNPMAFYYRAPYENLTPEKVDRYLTGYDRTPEEIFTFFDTAEPDAIRAMQNPGIRRSVNDTLDAVLHRLPKGVLTKHRKKADQLRKRDLCEVIWYITSKWPFEYGIRGSVEFESKVLSFGERLIRKLIPPLENVFAESKNDCARFLGVRYAKRMGLFAMELSLALSRLAIDPEEHLLTRNYAVATLAYMKKAVQMKQFNFIWEAMEEYLGSYREPIITAIELASNYRQINLDRYSFKYLQNYPSQKRITDLEHFVCA